MTALKVLLIATLMPAATPSVDLQPSSLKNTQPALAELLEKSPSRLGLEVGDQLTAIKTIPLRRGHVIRAARIHQGVRVLGQAVAIRINEAGQITRINSTFKPIKLSGVVPTITRKQAQLEAIRTVRGLNIPAALATGAGPSSKLLISARHEVLVWAIDLPGLTPGQHRVALIDALSGALIENASLTKHAEAPGLAYLPHPEPTGDLAAPEEVTLLNLLEPEDGTSLVLESDEVHAFSCLTSSDTVRVLTCDDIIPIFAGGFLPEGTSCNSPQLAAMVPAEFKHIAVGLCGTGHTALPEDGAFTHHLPVDRGDAINAAPFAAYYDAFAEMNMYYHVDLATLWFKSLGIPSPMTPLQTLANVTMPKQSFMDCATAQMTEADATDHETGVTSVTSCLVDYEASEDMAFGAFDNAFYMGGGQFADIFGFEDGGLFMGQGAGGDFAYDADVLYHEFGHNIVGRLGALQSGDLLDETGINSSPGALNEAYADYFSAAITGDAVVGGYIGNILTGGSGIRRLDHQQQCPDYWAGEVHADSIGWGAALWDARALYPQTEVDEATGLTVRVFDRVVFEGLSMLTTNMTQDDAARETIEAVKQESLLEDPEAALVTEVFTNRNVIACERIRPLTTDTPIEMMFVAGVGGGGGMMGGGPTYSPYAPPPVQFSIDVTKLGADAKCAHFSALLGQTQQSSEDVPDMLGGGSGGDVAWDMSLLTSTDGPITFTYSGSNVTATPDDSELAIGTVAGGGMTTFEATIPFPEGADTIHLALINRTADGGVLGNIRLTGIDEDCPAATDDTTTDTDDTTPADTNAGGGAEVKDGGEEDGGCAAGGVPSLLWMVLAGLGLARIRKTH